MKGLLSLDKDTLKTVITAVQEFSLYLTIAIAVALIATLLIVYFAKKESFELCKKFAVGVVVGYSVTLIAVLLCLQIARMKVKGEMDASFYLFVGFFVALLLVMLAGALVKKYAPKVYSYFSFIALAIVVIYAVILILNIVNAGTYENYEPQKSALYYVFSALLIAAIIVLAFVFDRENGTATETKSMAYAGVCIALSFALSYVKFFSLPMGGSVTLASMLPIMLYAYIFGARKGIFAGLIYGVLQFIQSPQPYQWMQILLDYPVAFSALGLAGIAKNFKFLKGNMIAEVMVGMVVAVLFRYAAHVVSGYFLWSTMATDSSLAMNAPLLYSLAYNSFTLVDLAIDIVAAALIFSAKSMRNAVAKVNPPEMQSDKNA